MIIQEQDLERLIKCPLMVPIEPAKTETCAKELALWVLHQSFEEKFKGQPADILHNIRGKVLDLWGNNIEGGSISRTVAFRLFNLILDFEVMHLEIPYNLTLNGHTIQGKYALLRRRRENSAPNILVLHDIEPSIRKEQAIPPDIITIARHAHAYINTGRTNAVVLHFPVFRGKPWYNKHISIPLAIKYLSDMLKIASLNLQYPSMGEHCKECKTKACLEIFNG